MTHVRALTIAVLASTISLGAGVGVASDGELGTAQQLAEVRRATAKYHDVAQAEADGYRLASGCVDATLFGRTLDQPVSGGPPFHTLHAWVWQGNPDGVFAAHNPNVSCG